jgi:hypothetical protein
MEEQHVKLWAKSLGTELVLVSVATKFFQYLEAVGRPVDIKAERARLKEAYSTLAVRNADPAISDMMCAELLDAIDETLTEIEQNLAAPR